MASILRLAGSVGARRDHPHKFVGLTRCAIVLNGYGHAVRCRGVAVEVVQGNAVSRLRPLDVIVCKVWSSYFVQSTPDASWRLAASIPASATSKALCPLFCSTTVFKSLTDERQKPGPHDPE